MMFIGVLSLDLVLSRSRQHLCASALNSEAHPSLAGVFTVSLRSKEAEREEEEEKRSSVEPGSGSAWRGKK